jgi:hypothetical protein
LPEPPPPPPAPKVKPTPPPASRDADIAIAKQKKAEQEKKQKGPKQNLFGPNGALHWLRAAETDCGNVDRGHHFAKQQASEDEHDRGYAA